MAEQEARYPPGRVRDAIIQVLSMTSTPLSVRQIETRVCDVIKPTPSSSIRSYLRLYNPEQQTKLRNGKGGVWRIPPSFDGHRRSPVPSATP